MAAIRLMDDGLAACDPKHPGEDLYSSVAAYSNSAPVEKGSTFMVRQHQRGGGGVIQVAA
jgi:hypothetical protein